MIQQKDFKEGFTKDYFKDPNNLEWINYRSPKYGDDEYLENVLRYLNNHTIITLNKQNGEQVVVMYTTDQQLVMH